MDGEKGGLNQGDSNRPAAGSDPRVPTSPDNELAPSDAAPPNAPLTQSLQFRLARAISIAVAAMATVAGILSFRATLHETHEFQDEILEQAAELLARDSGKAAKILLSEGACFETDDDEEGLIIQHLPRNSESRNSDSAGSDKEPGKDGRKQDEKGSSDEQSDNTEKKLREKQREKHDDDDDDEPRCLPLPASLKSGFHPIRHRGEDYRVYIQKLKDGSRIAVSQETQIRDQLAQQSALYTTLPILILVPLLIVLVLILLRLMLKPLAALARTVEARRDDELQPLSAQGLPSEITPLVTAINGLLARTGAAMAAQRRFVADAAHELRSPFAALSLQAERLKTAPMSAEAAERLGTLRAGIERGRHLLDQLLSLARAQQARPMPGLEQAAPDTGTSRQAPPAYGKGAVTGAEAGPHIHPRAVATDKAATGIAVLPVVQQVLADLLPLADEKRLNLGMLEAEPQPGGMGASTSGGQASNYRPAVSGEAGPDATGASDTLRTGRPTACPRVLADELSLYTLLRNLVDNAIRYTPAEGQIDLLARADGLDGRQVLLVVEDSGPGIAPEERTRVLDPFHRVLGTGVQGSGLGLSIVQTLVSNLNGSLALKDAQAFASGLRVEVRLPAA